MPLREIAARYEIGGTGVDELLGIRDLKNLRERTPGKNLAMNTAGIQGCAMCIFDVSWSPCMRYGLRCSYAE